MYLRKVMTYPIQQLHDWKIELDLEDQPNV